MGVKGWFSGSNSAHSCMKTNLDIHLIGIYISVIKWRNCLVNSDRSHQENSKHRKDSYLNSQFYAKGLATSASLHVNSTASEHNHHFTFKHAFPCFVQRHLFLRGIFLYISASLYAVFLAKLSYKAGRTKGGEKITAAMKLLANQGPCCPCTQTISSTH